MPLPNYNPFKNNGQGLSNYFKDLFKPSQQVVLGGTGPITNPKNLSGYNFAPYQVRTGDTFDNIAAANNLTVPELQAANGGMYTPPPKGSMINLPNAGVIQYNQPAGPSANWMLEAWKNKSAQAGAGQAGTYGPGTYTHFFSVADLKEQIASGIPPEVVPASMLAQLGATPQSMRDNGYTFNAQTGTYTLGGAQAGQVTTSIGTGSQEFMSTGFMQQNAAQGVGFYNQLRWDPVRGEYVQIGKLIREGRLDVRTGKLKKRGFKKRHNPNRAGQQQAEPVKPEDHQWGSPTTVLDLHLGGG